MIVNGNVETESPLITIKAFSKTEYYDDFDTKDYEKLAENDQHAYYVKLGYLPDSNLNLSFEDVQNIFVPISE